MRRLLSVLLSQVQVTRKKKPLEKNSYLSTVHLRVMKVGQHMDVDDPKVDLEGQGQGHKLKKTLFQVPFDHLTGNL